MKNNILIGITGITILVILLSLKKKKICKKKKNKKTKLGKCCNNSGNKDVCIETIKESSKEKKLQEDQCEIKENKIYYRELEKYISSFLALQENGLIKPKKALTFFIKEGFSINQIKKSYQLYDLYLDDEVNIKNFIRILYSKSIFDCPNTCKREIRNLY